MSGDALGLGVWLGEGELDGVGEQVVASAVAPPTQALGQPQAEQDGAPPVEKVPAGQGVGFTEERGQ